MTAAIECRGGGQPVETYVVTDGDEGLPSHGICLVCGAVVPMGLDGRAIRHEEGGDD